MSIKKRRRNEKEDKQHPPGCVCQRCLVRYVGAMAQIVSAHEQKIKYIESVLLKNTKENAPQ